MDYNIQVYNNTQFLFEVHTLNVERLTNEGFFIDDHGNIYTYNFSGDPDSLRFSSEQRFFRSRLVARIDTTSFLYLRTLINRLDPEKNKYLFSNRKNRIIPRQNETMTVYDFFWDDFHSHPYPLKFSNDPKLSGVPTPFTFDPQTRTTANGSSAMKTITLDSKITTSATSNFPSTLSLSSFPSLSPTPNLNLNEANQSESAITQYLKEIEKLVQRIDYIDAHVEKEFHLRHLKGCYVCGYDWKFNYDKNVFRFVNSVSDCTITIENSESSSDSNLEMANPTETKIKSKNQSATEITSKLGSNQNNHSNNSNSINNNSNSNDELNDMINEYSSTSSLLPGQSCTKTYTFMPLMKGIYMITGRLERYWEIEKNKSNDNGNDYFTWIINIT